MLKWLYNFPNICIALLFGLIGGALSAGVPLPGIFKDVNVVEILRVGLGGVTFLLSLVAFWLIRREQSRQATTRKGILRAIYFFMIANLVSAILVADVAQIVPQLQEAIRPNRIKWVDWLGKQTTDVPASSSHNGELVTADRSQ